MTEICWSVTLGLYLKGLESCFTLPSTVLGTTDTTSPPWCWLWVPAVWKACRGSILLVRTGIKVLNWWGIGE